MSLPALRVTIDGLPVTEIAPHSPPVWETWADGGSGSLTFDLAMSPKRTHHLLNPGARVQMFIGIAPLFDGLASVTDRSEWQITAYGHAAHARELPALDGLGAATRNLVTAATTARNSWGWVGADPTGVMTGMVAAGDDGGPQPLGALFDQKAQELGMRWGVDARGRWFMRADPTTPNLVLAPEVAALGQTSEQAPSHIAARYLDSTTNDYQTAFWPIGTKVLKVDTIDITDRGALSIIQANAIAGGILARRQNKAAWTSGMTVHRSQLQSNGTHPFLPVIRAGSSMVQLVGVPAAFAAGTTLNVTIGKTRFDASTPDQIYLEPVQTAPNGLGDVVAA